MNNKGPNVGVWEMSLFFILLLISTTMKYYKRVIKRVILPFVQGSAFLLET